MFIKVLQNINGLNEFFFAQLDGWIEKFTCADWIKDALIDSLHMVPFLLVVFFIIGIVEYFYSEKSEVLASKSAGLGPLLGSLLATVPQCGFSVLASGLYSGRLITMGTLLAVYLATSDEALPVMLAEPDKYHLILPLLGVKLFIALFVGYGLDLILKLKGKNFSKPMEVHVHAEDEIEEGCCHHIIHPAKKLSLWLHPIIHTINIFIFIFLVTLVLNYAIMRIGGEENLGVYLLNNSQLQPVVTAVFGLIPNCAVSIAITLMYMKGAISFGSVVSGLCSSAGLGLLVLFRKNPDKKDTLKVVLVLLGVSIFAGLVLQILCK